MVNKEGYEMLKFYLAGPDVFRKDSIEHGRVLKNICLQHGVQGLYPLDNEVDLTDKAKARDIIKRGNQKMIRECDAVIANIDSFRGAGADNGTTYEIGFAESMGKPCFLYVTDYSNLRSYKDKVTDPGNLYPIVEDFNLPDNLMFGSLPTFFSFDTALKECIRWFGEQ